MVSSLYNNDNYLGGICGMNGGGPLQAVIIKERLPTLFGVLGLVAYVVEVLIRFLIAIIPDQ